jgi:pimeloyl-ACP methyl ester carboxylesterase
MEMGIRFDGGSGRPVVFLHGFPGNGSDWEPVARRMAGDSRTVVVDLLGFGSSPRPERFEDLWTDAQAPALAAILDRLGIERTVLVGHDYGGPVALTFLDRYPERVTHLAVLSTNAFGDTPVDFPLALLRLPVLGPMLEPAFFGRWPLAILGRVLSRTRGVRAARNDASEARTIRTVFARVLRDLPGLYGPIEASLSRIRVPTAVIWGDRDRFFPVDQGRRTAAAIPGARFVLLEGCGHLPQIERTEAVHAVLRELLGDEGLGKEG